MNEEREGGRDVRGESEYFNCKWATGCRMSASRDGVGWCHSHADTVRCPLRPGRPPAIHWRAA